MNSATIDVALDSLDKENPRPAGTPDRDQSPKKSTVETCSLYSPPAPDATSTKPHRPGTFPHRAPFILIGRLKKLFAFRERHGIEVNRLRWCQVLAEELCFKAAGLFS
jgi:hypothetical protein